MKSNRPKYKQPHLRLLSLILFLPLFLSATPNPQFGFVGTGGRAFADKFDLPYYTLEGNYHSSTGTLFSSVHPSNDPAPGKKVVREVAKLNVRIDGLGESNAQFQTKVNAFSQALISWYLGGMPGDKPTFTWYAPDIAALAASEETQIIQTLEREKARQPAITGTVWEIGNEPNLFPAITPIEYAALFSQYYSLIKTKDPDAKVALGSFFLREPAEDLRPRMEEEIAANLKKGGLAEENPLFNVVYSDITTTLFSRIFATGTLEYFKACMNALDPTVIPDLITLHIYPYDDRPPILGFQEIKAKTDSLLLAMDAFLATKNLHLSYWVTEFGNINPILNTPEKVALHASNLIDIFEANSQIQKWFYYKATGADQQFSLFPNTVPPLTRLAKDSTFEPSNGDFPCGRLNAVGLMYFQRSTGTVCEEKLSFALSTSAATESQVPGAINVTLNHDAWDTVTVQFVLKSGSAQNNGIDFTLVENTLEFLPGEKEKTIYPILNDDALQEGDEAFVLALRHPTHAGLSSDSLHTFTIVDNDNDTPLGPIGLVCKPGFGQIHLSWNRSIDQDLIRYYVFQGTSPDTLILVDSTRSPIDTALTCLNLKNGQSYYFKIQACDSALQRSPFSQISSSTPVNTPPTITSLPRIVAIEETPFVYLASAVDLETKPIVTFSNYPSWLRVQGDSLVGIPVVTLGGSPETRFLITVTDGEKTDSLSVVLSVKAINHKPRIDSIVLEKSEVAEGDSVLLQAVATDLDVERERGQVQGQGLIQDRDSLHYLWIKDGTDTLGKSAQLFFRPGFFSSRILPIKLVVRDAFGLNVDSTFEIRVKNTSIPPLLSGLPPTLNHQTSFVLGWSKSGRDPDLDSAYRFEVGLFQDSGLTLPVLIRDSLNEGLHSLSNLQGLQDFENRKIWIAVRARDSKNYTTVWNIPQFAIYMTAPTTGIKGNPFPQAFSFAVFANRHYPTAFEITVLIPYGKGGAVPVTFRETDVNGRNSLWKWSGPLRPGRHHLTLKSDFGIGPIPVKNTFLEMTAPGFRSAKKL